MKGYILFILFFLPSYKCTVLETNSVAHTGLDAVRKAPRWNIPWLGLGMWCNGCPPVGCEDDEAIIHGYCCGCAHLLDKLPVVCPEFLMCPLNVHGLCHDYEYMMRCCC